MANTFKKKVSGVYYGDGNQTFADYSTNSASRPSFDRPQSMNLSKSKYRQTTYNENFPWLNESSYKKLENAVDKLWYTWAEKQTAMNQWYRNNVKYLLNDQILEERGNEINEQAYKAAELKSPEADAQLRMTEFSQALKKKYNLDATANDLDVFNTFVTSLWEEWIDLAWQYLAWENKKLRYDAGLETFGEKVEDVWVWILQSPWKRGYNMVWQRVDKLTKPVWERMVGLLSDEQKQEASNYISGLVWEETFNDFGKQTRDQIEKWTIFNGREQTNIRKPILWEERADNKYTKAWEVVGDIWTAIALTAPAWATLAPIMADSSVGWAALLWGMEWALDTALTHYWSEWNLDISPTEWILWVWGWVLWGLFTRYLANLPKNQAENVRKEASKYIEKSIKPTVKWKTSQAEYNKFIDDTLDVANLMSKNKEVLQYTDDAGNVIRWELPKNMRETSETLWNLKKIIYDQYNDIAKQAWDNWARVNMNKAFNQLDDLTKDISQNISNPETKAIVDRFKNTLLEYTDDAWTIAIDDAQKITQDFNQQLTAFFKNPNMNDVSKSSIVAKLNKWTKDAINDSIDDAFESSISNWSKMSTQYNQLKQFYSKIKTIEDEISKRALVDARKNAKWLSSTILDSLAWGEFTEALLTIDPVKLWKAWAMKVISKYYNYLNNPNTQLRNLFDLVEKTNNPTVLQNAKSTVWNAIRSTAQKSAPIVWTISPSAAWITANELTKE